jgi:hypothetical protein
MRRMTFPIGVGLLALVGLLYCAENKASTEAAAPAALATLADGGTVDAKAPDCGSYPNCKTSTCYQGQTCACNVSGVSCHATSCISGCPK